jgi:voltage-dependent calcium channel
MLYYSRKFKRHMELKRSARMTMIPQLDVPEILVDNEDDRANREGGGNNGPTTSGPDAGGFLSAQAAQGHQRHWSNISADLSTYDMSYGHPLASPRASGPASPSHRNHTSAFSFELHETGDGTGEEDDIAGGGGPRGSSVSPAQVREMLDDSAWVKSIRRSATQRRGGGPAGGY